MRGGKGLGGYGIKGLRKNLLTQRPPRTQRIYFVKIPDSRNGANDSRPAWAGRAHARKGRKGRKAPMLGGAQTRG